MDRALRRSMRRASTRCCRRPSARAAAIPGCRALRGGHRRAARPTSINARRAAAPPSTRSPKLLGREYSSRSIPRTASSRRRGWPGSTRSAASAARAACRPAPWMPSSAPAKYPAHRARGSLHGLRAVPGALPGRLHRDAPGRTASAASRRSSTRQRYAGCTRPASARSKPTERQLRARREEGRRAARTAAVTVTSAMNPAKRARYFRAASRGKSGAAHRA